MSILIIEVEGIPAPQGSKRHVGGGRMVESSKKVGPWRDAVASAAHQAAAVAGTPQFTGPTKVTIAFDLPMPKSRSKADRVRGWAWSSRRPDIDKLARSTLDALTTSEVISDDSIIASIHVVKRENTRQPGAYIALETLGYAP